MRRTPLAALLAALPAWANAQAKCAAEGEPVQWIADYCMSNTHFKTLMCEEVIRNGTRPGPAERCVADPRFKGRTVERGGVGG